MCTWHRPFLPSLRTVHTCACILLGVVPRSFPMFAMRGWLLVVPVPGTGTRYHMSARGSGAYHLVHAFLFTRLPSNIMTMYQYVKWGVHTKSVLFTKQFMCFRYQVPGTKETEIYTFSSPKFPLVRIRKLELRVVHPACKLDNLERIYRRLSVVFRHG